MIENAPRQIILVLALIVGAMLSLFWKSWERTGDENLLNLKFGNDLAGGTEFIYEVDPEKLDPDPDRNWEEFMGTTIATIAGRIDPDGVLNAEVVRRGQNGIYIGLPKVSAVEVLEIKDKITRLGTLRMQICARDDYIDGEDNKLFDLTKERDRLKAWLAKEDNKAKCIKDPLEGIARYHATSTEEGGPLLGQDKLQWIPHKIEGKVTADGERGDERDGSLSNSKPSLASYVVPTFEPDELSGPVTAEKPYLLEYVPVNFDEVGFSGEMLIADKVQPSVNQDGSPVVVYELKPEYHDEYGRISSENIDHHSAIIMDGYIKSAPYYISKISGRGQIQGFTRPEAQLLSDVLKRGSLKIKPELQSQRTVGPTLGAESIRRGGWSLVIGAGVVLLFILFYYRVAGIVATVGILLNVSFVFGAVSFIGATLTLPGIAGLVLTIGMAVDANILIYERIREEIKTGKELLQAVRHGFERAIVTILDANVTTFIAGLVLYNVGVGPIRGFAVTLMIGIATSLFTSFFVSRLIFHFLLERKMETLRMTDWFGGLRFNFLRFSKPAIAISSVVIVAGLVIFFTTPASTAYALDFTGGADIRVVTKNKLKPSELGEKLAKNAAFKEMFDDRPQINAVQDGTTSGHKYSIKLKVGPKLKEQIKKAEEDAEKRGEVYKPPFVELVAAALEDDLVPKAFTNANITAGRATDRTNYADIVVHYTDKVPVAKVKEVLLEAFDDKKADIVVSAAVKDADGKYRPNKEATEAADLLLEFDLPKRYETPVDLITFTNEKLSKGEFNLSDPIPDVATLGGRMVGELKSAAITALVIALFCIVMYIRVRFREYEYGLGAVAALAHDVLVALGLVVLCNRAGLVDCELSLSMIAAFLTIVGYSINDTIVIFDRIRENLTLQAKTGDSGKSFADTVNLSINQTLGRTILTSCTTLFVVGALFAVNYGGGSDLEGFSFAMIIGVFTGTYSTIFIASPIVMWLRSKETPDAGLSDDGGLGEMAPIDAVEQPVGAG